MINAAIKGKSLQTSKERATEDALTSSVFGRLILLPDELFFQILKETCKIGSDFSNEKLESYSFWPKWLYKIKNETSESNNKIYCEPDVFIQTTNFDIILECKRYDFDMQDEKQWKEQIEAYKNKKDTDGKRLIYCAMGGNKGNLSNKEHFGLTIHKASWFQLSACIQSKRNGSTGINPHILRILDEILRALTFFGFFEVAWLSSFPDTKQTINYESSKTFIEWKIPTI